MRQLIVITITLGFDLFILNETETFNKRFYFQIFAFAHCAFSVCSSVTVLRFPFRSVRDHRLKECNAFVWVARQIDVSFHVVLRFLFSKDFVSAVWEPGWRNPWRKESARTTWKLTPICLVTQNESIELVWF